MQMVFYNQWGFVTKIGLSEMTQISLVDSSATGQDLAQNKTQKLPPCYLPK